MHCGGWLILLHPAIYFSGKEGFHKAAGKAATTRGEFRGDFGESLTEKPEEII